MNRPTCLSSLLLVVGLLVPVALRAQEPLGTYEKLCQKGRQQLAKGRLDEAIDSYTRAIDEDPSEPLALVSRGLAYCAKHEYGKAEQDARGALAVDEKNLDARLVLATALRLMNQYEKAEEAFNHAIYELDERSADAYNGRGRLYADMHDDRQAERDFSKAISLNSKLEGAYLERAAIYMRGGREIGQAIRDYSSVIDELKKVTPEYYYLRSRARLEAERYDEAIDDARKAAKAVPDYVAAHGVLTVALFNQRKYDKADEALKQAEYHAESEPGVLLWRGRILAAEEKYEEALTKYEQALEVDADFLPALKASIDAYEALEDSAQVETLQAEVERIETELEKREKDEHLLWAVVQGIPGASKDLTDERSREIAQRKARDESAKQLARQYAEDVRKNTRSLQKDCQEIEIAEVVSDECDYAEAIIKTAGKRFDEEEYEIAAADFRQGEIRYREALEAYEGIVSKDHSYWKKWAFERAGDMDDDYAPVMTWLALAEACCAMDDQEGYERAIGKAMLLIDSDGLLNPVSGCVMMLRAARLRIECDDLEGAREALRAAADFSEGVSSLKTRATLFAHCAGAAIKCDKRDLWPTYLTEAVRAAEQADFAPRDLRTRHMFYIKCCAYSEAWATEEAYRQAQGLVQFLGERWATAAQALVAELFSHVGLAAMQNKCSTDQEKVLFETSYLKAMRELLASKPTSEFAVTPRYVVAKADAVGGEYLRAWCGATILADPGNMATVGGLAVRGACEDGNLKDARTMYEAFLKSRPPAAAVRHLADAEARLGDQPFVRLRHWVHDMPQNATQADAMIGLAAGVKSGRIQAADEKTEEENPLDDSPELADNGITDLEEILKLQANGDPERAMRALVGLLEESRKKKKLMTTFDAIASSAPAWWLEEAMRRIDEVEDPHVRAALWLQIAKTHLAAGDMDGYRDSLTKIESCWIAMWSRIYTRRCPPTKNRYEGHFYWEFDHDLEETETDEIQAMLRVLFDIEKIQTGLGEKEGALETLLLAARCAERMPRKSGFTAALSPSYSSLWMKRIGGRLKLRGQDDLAAIAIGPSPPSPGVRRYPMNWYRHSLASFEAQDLDELRRLAQVSEERSHDGADFIYSARLSALLALAAARKGDTVTYRQAAMRAASLMRRGSRNVSAPVMCDLARAAVAADMPDIACDYVDQASRHYEDRGLTLTEIAQSLAKQGKIEKAEEMAEGLRSPIPKTAAYHAIILAKALQSKDSLSEVYEDIEYYYKPSAQAAGYAAVAEALLTK